MNPLNPLFESVRTLVQERYRGTGSASTRAGKNTRDLMFVVATNGNGYLQIQRYC